MGRFVNRTRISHLSLTPSALGVMPPGNYPALTTIMVAGEVCPRRLVEEWAQGRSFFNAYGPTEATVEASYSLCTEGRAIDIGQPFSNVGVCILDKSLRPVPRGQTGELCILGMGLARGYRNQPELTAHAFPTLPPARWLESEHPQRAYRTGDLARISADGTLEFLGRMDQQFKYRGYRIEPSEIETALCASASVVDAAVSKVTDGAGRERLIAHIVAHPECASLDLSALRSTLAATLPSYMIPSPLLPVSGIPRTPNGKRDISALAPPPVALQAPAPKSSVSPTESRILDILGNLNPELTLLDVRACLSDEGIDSLALAELLLEVEREFNVVLDISFEPGMDNVERLALAVDGQQGTKARQPRPAGGHLDLADLVRRQIRSWPGAPAGARNLLRHFSDNDHHQKLFWIFQAGHELRALNDALQARGMSLFGMRSGHLLFPYSDENMGRLSAYYADEIESVCPDGPINLGGNCQGGMIAHSVALELEHRGRSIGGLVLMEQGRFPFSTAPAILVFGEKSYLNPYATLSNPDDIFKLSYPAGYKVEMITGPHGQYFQNAHINSLADAITRGLRWHRQSRQPANENPAARTGSLTKNHAHGLWRAQAFD